MQQVGSGDATPISCRHQDRHVRDVIPNTVQEKNEPDSREPPKAHISGATHHQPRRIATAPLAIKNSRSRQQETNAFWIAPVTVMSSHLGLRFGMSCGEHHPRLVESCFEQSRRRFVSPLTDEICGAGTGTVDVGRDRTLISIEATREENT